MEKTDLRLFMSISATDNIITDSDSDAVEK